MLLNISYYGHNEVIDEEVLVICVEERIKDIMAEKRARRVEVVNPNDPIYKRLVAEDY